MTRRKHLNFENESNFTDLPDLHTRKGDRIAFRYFLGINADDSSSRGLIINSVAAFVGSEEVGYLDIAYIRRQRFQELWPTNLHTSARSSH